MQTRLEVAIPGEGSRYYPIEQRSVIGASADADVVLGVPGVAQHHFRLELGPGHVDVRLAPGARPLCYAGKRFVGGKLGYDQDFYLEQLRFNCRAPNGSSPRQRLVWLTLALLAPALLIGLALPGPARDARLGAPDEAIELFATAPACPDSEPASALRHAERLEGAARAKRERHRYDPHDGVEAGRLYAEASACFERAGDARGRERTESAGAGWRARVTEELRAAQLRLRAALADQRTDAALRELAALRRLTKNEPHRYARWLEEKERALRSKPPAR
jgi:hypothetical protein